MQKRLALLKPIFREKTTIFTFILIGIVMSLTIIVKTYYDTSYHGYYGDIRENIDYNTYWVSKINEEKVPVDDFRNKVRSELEEIEHVVGVFHNMTWQSGAIIEQFKKDSKRDGRINLRAATNESLPQIVEGGSFPNDNNEDYIICPENFFPIGDNLKKYNRFDMVNLKKYLNKKLTLKYMNYNTMNENLELSFKLVGIYKNSATSTDENVCYVKENTLNTMYINGMDTSSSNIITDQNYEEAAVFYVQVDQYKNMESVKKELEHLNYSMIDTIVIPAYDQFDKIASNISTINIVLNVVIFVLIFLVLMKQFFDNCRYYNLLYCLGYTKRDICFIHMIVNFILIIFSSTITLILSIFMKSILDFVIYFKPFIFSKFELIMNYSSLWYIIPLAMITSFIASILGCIKLSTNEVNIK